MSAIVKNHDVGLVKSAGADINSREAQVAHSRGFGNMVETAQKSAGLPGDQMPYWDPMGFLGREPINMKSRHFDKWKGVFDRFNDLSAQGYAISDAAEKAVTEKAVDRTSYSLPIYFTPEVFITDREDTPLADMLARVAVQEDTIKVDELTDIGNAGQFDEAQAWDENDDTYANHTYDVVAYGRQNQVTDFVQLAASTLRSTRALTEDQQVTAIRQYEERQLIQGTNNDLNGYDGLRDIADAANIEDAAGATITLGDVRNLITNLRRDGTNRDNVLVVTDHKTHQDLMDATDDYTRFESPDDNLSFGFQTLDVDGVPVVESHGTPDTDGAREMWAFDASAHYMGMLQDVTMHPLARTTPQETFATDAYGTFVSESPGRIQAMENLA